MPSRKITDRCSKCASKNHLQALFCNHCGTRLVAKRLRPDDRGRAKLHADIAHPINVRCRREIQESILKGYEEELARSHKPGYVPQNFEEEFDAGPEYDEIPSTSGITPVTGSPAVEGVPADEGEEPENDGAGSDIR